MMNGYSTKPWVYLKSVRTSRLGRYSSRRVSDTSVPVILLANGYELAEPSARIKLCTSADGVKCGGILSSLTCLLGLNIITSTLIVSVQCLTNREFLTSHLRDFLFLFLCHSLGLFFSMR